MAFGRLPNGLGTITKLKRNLRKPYRAMKLVGEELNEDTMKVRRVYRTVGYYQTRKDAMEALMKDGGISHADKPLTFKNVYDGWSAQHFPTVQNGMVYTYQYTLESFRLLFDRPFAELKTVDYEMIMRGVPPVLQAKCRTLLSQMYQYALRNEIVEKDYSKLVKFSTKHDTKKKQPFSPDDVKRMWELNDTLSRFLLVGIYTGFRPSELIELEAGDVSCGYFIGGKKTENGRNRLVPIHPDILSIVKEEARKSANFGSTRLFTTDKGEPYVYMHLAYLIRKQFPGHSLHEIRHSFVTYARRSGMDPVIIKRIVGHSLKDLTEEVYTHVDADILIAEMKKFRVA